MAAQPALEAEQVQHISYGAVVLLSAQVRVILVPLLFFVQTAFTAGQRIELLHAQIVRRDKAGLAICADDRFAQAFVVEDLFAAKIEILPVVVKGQIYALSAVQRFREHAHAQSGAEIDVFQGSRGEQGEPRRRPVYGHLRDHTVRCFARGELRHAALFLANLKPFIADGAPGTADGVGL